MITKGMKLVGGSLFFEGVFGVAVSQDQRVLSDIGRLWKIACGHSAGK